MDLGRHTLQTQGTTPAVSGAHGWFARDGDAGRAITALTNGSPDERVGAAEAVASFRVTVAEDALISCLEHPNTRVREAAASALGACGSADSITPCIRALLDERVSLAATRCLLRGFSSAASDEIASLTRHESALVRSLAVRELGGREGCDAALIEALLDPDEAVRVQALLALSAQRGHLPAATTSRILELSHDSAINVRAAACSALAACGDTAAITRLNQLTTDASPWVGHCATNALKGLRRANMGELTFDAIGEGVNG